MVENPAESRPKRLGSVWLYCPYPTLARGLVEILEPESKVHHGVKPPADDETSLVVFCVSEAEEVSQGVKDLRTQAPGAVFVVFGLSNDLYLARSGLQAGARGFVHAGMEPSQIIRALSVVSRGETAVPRELLNDLVSGEEDVDLSELTHRQQEILKLVAEGQTNAQISQQLFLSESTIKQHLRAAYKVLGVHNRTEAARIIRKRADL